jgi:hypothetical protein
LWAEHKKEFSMKSKIKWFSIIFMVVIAFLFTACGDGNGSGGGPGGKPSLGPGNTVPGETLTDKLKWLSDYAKSNTAYIVEVNANESISYMDFSYGDKTGISITLIGTDEERVISPPGVWVESGITLILDNNITLQGSGDKNAFVFVVGELVMNVGSKIIGHTNINVLNTLGGGGGVNVYGGTFTMNGGEISGNTGSPEYDNGFYGGGGGVYVKEGTFTMNGGKISNNTAAAPAPGASTSIRSSSGGGVHVSSNGTFIMNGGEISGNHASNDGGGVCVRENGTFIMNGGEISGNIASNNGGGVYMPFGDFTMSGLISGNTATNGSGGGVFMSSGTLTMNDGKISGNNASNSGGGVEMIFGTLTMNNGEISGNIVSASNGSGGGVSGALIMNDGKISGNTAYNGGGVAGGLTMNDGEITGNTASYRGGGVGGRLTMNDGKISGNTASYGGGVYATATSTMHNGEISGNTASGYSAVYVEGETYRDNNRYFTMYGGEIVGNSGRGVYVGQGTNNNTFFRIVTGTIYGSGEGTNSNTSGSLDVRGSAQYGTFNGSTWIRSGDLNTTSNTIRVVDGELMSN